MEEYGLHGYQSTIISNISQQITCEIMFIPLQISFRITYVYAFNSQEERKDTWKILFPQSKSCNKPWLVLGDFNSM